MPKNWEELPLFDVGEPGKPGKKAAKVPRFPMWSDQKARLIARYLFYFVQIAKHGTYIDGFAGAQYPDRPNMWTARLVLEEREHEPWLRHFHLFDIVPAKVEALRGLTDRFPERVQVYDVDFNIGVGALLRPEIIPAKEATFCLLDQHTFECRWDTVGRLATYDGAREYKIELFYFLAEGWLGRALAAQKDRPKLIAWWGRDDVDSLRDMTGPERAELLCSRFEDEFGYRYTRPFGIFEREHGLGRVMYYMVHASDHPEAIPQMTRAYNEVVNPIVTGEQLQMY
jgi:three-Cys-motif partner protein